MAMEDDDDDEDEDDDDEDEDDDDEDEDDEDEDEDDEDEDEDDDENDAKGAGLLLGTTLVGPAARLLRLGDGGAGASCLDSALEPVEKRGMEASELILGFLRFGGVVSSFSSDEAFRFFAFVSADGPDEDEDEDEDEEEDDDVEDEDDEDEEAPPGRRNRDASSGTRETSNGSPCNSSKDA